ncbi:AraC family transcriptional regulator of arabinose operon [Paenibacillus shirakamiensis]|uniref:AraC family transcriptional regulator of arabinose operon n=1 Tax=Paenibacillus shirakamiensis TaxID=1265935 RepID=A0ABS4JEK2_9BACL|nr:AraC family transcriptional regulator [Paenibacillus shirakamiensis]MBP1999391.1 AraC family transcriptional regulator of arabinose operon [Paenibacillus shirakamiensis]
MNNEPHMLILSAGYSMHRKPYVSVENEGMDHYLIRLQTEGKARTRCDGRLVTVEAGDLLIFPPSVPYELRIEGSGNKHGDMTVFSGDYYILLQGTWIESWWQSFSRPNKLKVPLSDGFLGIFRQITLEQQRIDNPSPIIAEYYLKILCMEIDRQLQEMPQPTNRTYMAYQLKQYIEENATSAFKLEDAAAHVGISVSRAVHLFKAAFGTSIMQHALEVRLNMARERIIFSHLSLEHVAESSGFPSYNYFHKVFRARFGMSPKQFRQVSRTPES